MVQQRLFAGDDDPQRRPHQRKGSRGLSGLYAITEDGKAFVEGQLRVPKNIVKPFGESEWTLDGPLVGINEALHMKLVVTANNIVLNGTTYL